MHARLDNAKKVLGPNRFGDKVIAADAQRVQLFLRILLAGQEDDRYRYEFRVVADHRGQVQVTGGDVVAPHDDEL